MKTTFFIAFLFSFNFIFGQKNEVKISLPEFLVGLSNDFNGKEISPEHPTVRNNVTFYFQSQKKAYLTFIDSLTVFNRKYNYDFETSERGFLQINSEKFSSLFNSFYTFELVDDMSISDLKNDQIEYEVYWGTLKQELFDTPEKKISFLVGAFILNGKKNKNQFEMTFGNSTSFYKASRTFMNNLGFTIIKEVETLPDNIPHINTIYFEVPNQYKDLFNKDKKKP